AGHGLTLALAGARVVLGALTTNGETFAVTEATVAANVHQTLDVELNFRAQYAFGLVLSGDDSADFASLRFGPVLHLFVDIDASFGEDFNRVAPANAENVSQGDFAALVVRDVYPCDTSHSGCEMFADQKARQRLGRRLAEEKFNLASTQGSGFLKIDLALTLLEAGVLLVDNVELAVAADDFAINATFLHRAGGHFPIPRETWRWKGLRGWYRPARWRLVLP
nr:hypothetical protein [Tanacetum cinerariifolium]